MRYLFLTITVLIAFSINAQNEDWINQFLTQKKVNIKELGDIRSLPWSKHIERYRWEESNSLDEDGFIIPKNTKISNFLKTKNETRSNQAFGNWAPIGLTSWTNGNSGYNPGNGRINGVTVDPNNSQVIFACAASGGIWKSIDGGNSWNTNTDDFPVLGTSDVAIDPNNSNNVYFATGDRDAFDTYGVGVYKSTDGGANWSPSGLFNNFSTQELVINALEIDPQQSNIIYAGSNEGLYKSIDYGENWYKVINSGSIMEIKVNPLNSNTVFAVSKNYFYRSHNGGESFNFISNGLQTTITRIAMDITPADTAYVYLLVAGINGDFNGVFRSTDGGTSFTKRYELSDNNILGYAQDGSDDKNQSWYDLAIAVSKTNKNKVYTGGVNVWITNDGGNTFNPFTEWSYNGDATYAHADIHSLDCYGNTLYCGSDGGVFKNQEDIAWENISDGLDISQIYKFSNTFDGTRISMGSQDNGTNRSINGVWKHIKGADGMATLINPSNSNIVYLSSQYGNFSKSTTGGDNNSSTFYPENYGEEGLWVTPIDICKDQPNNLIIGLENIYKTTNDGNYWASISNFTDGENFTDVAIAPSDPNYIYAAKDDNVYYTVDGGANWQTVNNPSIRPVTDIAISDTDPLDVYFLKSSSFTKVYHTPDGFQSLVSIAPNLFQTSSSAIALENNPENGVYLGTDFGVYYINDNLGDWVLYSDQLPNVKVTDVEIVNNKVRVATYGRGIWESDTYSTLVGIENAESYKDLKVFPNPAKDKIHIESKGLNISKIEIFNVSGILIDELKEGQNEYSISNLVSGVYFVKIYSLKQGTIIKRFIKS